MEVAGNFVREGGWVLWGLVFGLWVLFKIEEGAYNYVFLFEESFVRGVVVGLVGLRSERL